MSCRTKFHLENHEDKTCITIDIHYCNYHTPGYSPGQAARSGITGVLSKRLCGSIQPGRGIPAGSEAECL